MNNDDEFNKPGETIHEGDPVTGTVNNPSEKLRNSIPNPEREAAKLREQRDSLRARPGPADTGTKGKIVSD